MPIIGIDYEKCTNCNICLSACPDPERYIKRDEEENKIIFEDPQKRCILCGQCIAQCPEDAILYEGMGQPFAFEGIENLKNVVSYDSLFNFLASLRSIRHYKKEKVPIEMLNKVFKAMQYAATGANMRSENFYLISNPQTTKALSDAVIEELLKDPSTRDQWGKQIENFKKIYRIPVYFDAPHVIFVSSSFNMMIEGFNIGDIITYGRLAAQALGLGTCWNGWSHLAIQKNPNIKKIAKIRGIVVAAFTIGYPDVTYYRVPPRTLKEFNGLE